MIIVMRLSKKYGLFNSVFETNQNFLKSLLKLLCSKIAKTQTFYSYKNKTLLSSLFIEMLTQLLGCFRQNKQIFLFSIG